MRGSKHQSTGGHAPIRDCRITSCGGLPAETRSGTRSRTHRARA